MKCKNILKAGVLVVLLLMVFPVSVISAQPVLSIEPITGPIGVRSYIKNTGTADAIDVCWNITLTGGTIILPVSRLTEGTIASIPPGEKELIKSTLVFGIAGILWFGPVTITVNAKIPGSPPVSRTETPPSMTRVFLIFVW